MTWLIQDTTFESHGHTVEEGWEYFLDALRFHKQHVIQCDSKFYEHTLDMKIEGIDPTTIIPVGTKDFALYCRSQGIPIFYNENFHYSKLLEMYGSEMLNSDAKVAKLKDIQMPTITGNEKMWVRPNDGFNIVKGKVISCYSWDAWAAGMIRPRTDYHTLCPDVTEETLMVYAAVKEIKNEWRIFVVNGKAISVSQYYCDGEFALRNEFGVCQSVMYYAQKMCDQWLPCETCVLDISRNGADQYKVMEINCFNCSGWYLVNSGKVVEAVKNVQTN